jgi:hypothetical protein
MSMATSGSLVPAVDASAAVQRALISPSHDVFPASL